MSEQRTKWLDRATGVVALIAGVTAALTWFLGDVPRIARLALAALAGALVILLMLPARRLRLLYASTPVLLFLALAFIPATRSWLLQRGDESQPEGPLLAIEDVRPAWDFAPDSSKPERFRISIVIRNRGGEPVVLNRALLGYHQGGGDVGGNTSDLWLEDQVLALRESDSGQTFEIRQSDRPDDEFAVPVTAFAAWIVAGVWDQVIELRPQATIPAASLHTLRVTLPLRMRLLVGKDYHGRDTKITGLHGRTTIFFDRFNDPEYDAFPRLLTVTVNTASGRCATKTEMLERGKRESAKPRTNAFLSGKVSFKDLCSWSPPRPPAVN